MRECCCKWISQFYQISFFLKISFCFNQNNLIFTCFFLIFRKLLCHSTMPKKLQKTSRKIPKSFGQRPSSFRFASTFQKKSAQTKCCCFPSFRQFDLLAAAISSSSSLGRHIFPPKVRDGITQPNADHQCRMDGNGRPIPSHIACVCVCEGTTQHNNTCLFVNRPLLVFICGECSRRILSANLLC